ncbi:ABC transporter permease [Mesorhizobium sp. Root172]|uniref:ABC transporter permease n=1 Tax=Rhizobium loti TaxID=381 RepID=A0AA91J3I0_RHILI|nr:ABC transporter permease [Mesorhizobium sp. Root172]KRB23245.1 ABC transporter permease [Mesorhizobium sp. Root172]OBQ66587.1 ABC transporter permease [Mesorhizobium loti]
MSIETRTGSGGSGLAALEMKSVGAALLSPERVQSTAVWIGTILLAIWASAAVPGFASSANISAIMYSTSAVGIAAVGMAFITLSGNLFMLSMGATAAVSTIVFASFLHLGLLPSIVVVVLVGALFGLAQGIAVGVFKTNPIITTIAMASIITGAGSFYSGGLTIVGQGDASWLGIGRTAGIPNQIVLFLLAALVFSFIVERTRFGRELRLIGLNPKAAHFTGLRVGRTLVIAYVLAAAAAAFAGALYGSQAAQGNLKLGAGLDFDAIAAVLVGGVAIKGGQGRILDAAIGAVFLAIITNILLLKGLSLEIQLIVKGLVVIASVILGALALGGRK